MGGLRLEDLQVELVLLDGGELVLAENVLVEDHDVHSRSCEETEVRHHLRPYQFTQLANPSLGQPDPRSKGDPLALETTTPDGEPYWLGVLEKGGSELPRSELVGLQLTVVGTDLLEKSGVDGDGGELPHQGGLEINSPVFCPPGLEADRAVYHLLLAHFGVGL